MHSRSTTTESATRSASRDASVLWWLLLLSAGCSDTSSAGPVSTTTPAVPVINPIESTAPPPKEPLPELPVVPRLDWGAAPEGRGCKAQVLEHVSIHHTASTAPDTADGRRRARGFQRYHQQQGWMDLAYHFIVTREGEILEGRRLACAGDTFTKYDPAGHMLIVLDGNFEEQQPSPDQLQRTVELLAWAQQEHGLDPAALRGHRDMAATLCPGEALYAAVTDGSLAQQAVDLLQRPRMPASK